MRFLKNAVKRIWTRTNSINKEIAIGPIKVTIFPVDSVVVMICSVEGYKFTDRWEQYEVLIGGMSVGPGIFTIDDGTGEPIKFYGRDVVSDWVFGH